SQTNVARSLVVAFDPEFTWNYDLSFRSTWLDGKLVANANAFYIDWKDAQFRQTAPGNTTVTATRNAEGGITSRGSSSNWRRG
ncbi:MAG: TonB-dependent receptor, partial [Nitrospiraceae bacterium]|nr:TonB-dependent receptor [Nitrospiraceae bacterium]